MKSIYRLFFIVLFIPFFASAQNINDALRLGLPGLGSSARALGMGNSYIALSDDGSASFFNPAGMGLLKKLEVSGGIDYSNFNNNTTFLNTVSDHSNSSTRLNRLSFVFPFPTYQGSLVFGFSYNSVKDFTGALQFDAFNPSNSKIRDLAGYSDVPYELFLTDAAGNSVINNNVNQSGDVLSSGSINNWTLSGAVEVYRNIFIGANLNIISGSYTSANDYFEDDTRNIFQGIIDPDDPDSPSDFQSFEESRLYDWDLSGWDAKIGMIYQFMPQARFGMTIQFPKFFTVRETFDYSATSYFGSGDIYGYDFNDEVEFDIIVPFNFSAGFSANFKGLIVSTEATLIDYTQIEFDNGNGVSDTYLQSVNKNIKDQLKMVVNYNVGLEYNIPATGLRLRTGYMVQPSAYDDDPSEFNKQFVTAGLGFLVDDRIGFDIGFAHGWWKDFGDNYGSNVSRTFQDIRYNKFILTGIFRF
jgi:hypothetical protein